MQKILDKVLLKTGIKNDESKSILKKTSLAFVIKILNAVTSFVYNILLARMIGAEGAGVYYLAFSISSIVMLISNLGFNNVLLRFVSTYSGSGDWAKVKGIITKTFSFTILLAIIISGSIFFNAELIATKIFSNEALAVPLKLISLAILPMSLVSLSQEVLKGLEKYKESLIVGGLIVPLCCIPLVLFLASRYYIEGAVLAFVISNIIALIIAIILINKYVPQFRSTKGNFDTQLIFATSMPLFAMTVTNYVMTTGDLFLLGIWEDNYNIGIYGAAKRLSILVGFILIAVNSVITPKFAKLFAQDKIEELKSIAQKSTGLLIVLAFPILIIILLFPSQILSIMGKDFTGGSYILIILAIGQYLNVATGSVGYLLIMCGYEKIMRNNIIIVSIITLILYLLLIPTTGILGAACISAFGIVLQNLIAVFLVKMKLGFWVFPSLSR